MNRNFYAAVVAGFFLLIPLAQAQVESSRTETQGLVPRQLLGLVHAPEVHRELKLSPNQVRELEHLFSSIDSEWFRARNLPAEQQFATIQRLETTVRQWFQTYGSQAQRERVRQLEYQAQGIRMLLRPDLGQQLGLDAGQVSQLTELARRTHQAGVERNKARMRNEVSEEIQQSWSAANQAEQNALNSVVRPEQLRTLSQLLGEKFDVTQLKRIYPMAPELVPVENWINSRPLTLEQLRGKVVLLHFYAFQCPNCHANFEHYQKWHDEFGDQVVVLGIQTPETAMERDPKAVEMAARERGLEFPILVDLASENWKAWANTMWPTVYVIDKKGYIRQWWQGELNWNGATGDQTIHALITELLEESA